MKTLSKRQLLTASPLSRSVKRTLYNISMLGLIFFINLKPAVSQPGFTTDINQGCAPLTVTFTNTTPDTNAYYFQWGWDDGPSFMDSLTTTITHTYTNAGDYWPSLDVWDSLWNYLGYYNVSQNIQVQGPNNFWMSTDSICPGDEISFCSQNWEASSFSWDFGDGNTASEDCVGHTYDSTGVMIVTLILNTPTCGYDTLIDSLVVSDSVSTSAYFGINPNPACPGSSVNFNAYYPAATFIWNFGDGNPDDTTTGNNTNHSFADTGDYVVTLTVFNSCGNTDIKTNTVRIDTSVGFDPWSVNMNINPNPTCPDGEVNINADWGYSMYVWDYGDGSPTDTTSGNDGNYVNHIYGSVGNYPVSVIFFNSCGNDTTIYDTVYVDSSTTFDPWSVYLNLNPGSVCPGGQVGFDAAWGNMAYVWNYGDGSPTDSTYGDNANNTNHTYSSLGNYPVSVKIYNYCGNDTTLYNTVYVDSTVGFSSGEVSFNLGPNPSCPGGEVNFSTEDGYLSYVWDYGDGSPTDSTYGNESYWSSHIYANTGNYNASLKITNQCGIDTTLYATVVIDSNATFPNDPWSMNFNVNPNPSCPDGPVYLNAPSGYLAYVWDYGDGSPADSTYGKDANYTNHTYSSLGTYPVSLKITNYCGNDTILYSTVEIANNVGFPTDWFNIDVYYTPACPGEEVGFNAPWGHLAYVWNYGDGSPADSTYGDNANNSNHSYSDTGTYNISVKITNFCGMDTTIYNTVEIDNNANFPDDPGYSVNTWPDISCPGGEVYFNAPTGNLSYVWDYGDSTYTDSTSDNSSYHIYSDPGTYTFSVKITSFCGKDTTLYNTVVIDSTADFPEDLSLEFYYSPACPGQKIQLNAPSGNLSYVWDYGDGSPVVSSSDNYSTHSYSDTGTYNVSVNVTNFCGKDTTLYDKITIGENVGFPSNISLDISPNPTCPGNNVKLNAPYGYDSYMWYFGDGDSAMGSAWVNHIYDSLGSYTVSVNITNNCGIDTTLSATITVDTSAAFSEWIYFDAEPGLSCPGDLVTFYTEDLYVSYSWDFGDGDTALTTSNKIKHKYDSIGTYYASLTLTNGCGNSTTVYETIVVDTNVSTANVGFSIPFNPSCIGDEVFFSTEEGLSYTYSWDFGDNTYDTTIGAGATHIYADTGTYTATVIVTNGCGYTSTFSDVVYIDTNAVPSFDSEMFGTPGESGVAGCPGDAVLFYFMGTSDNVWDFGDGYTDVATDFLMTDMGFVVTVIMHAYDTAGTYTVKLTLINSCGNSATDSIYVTIAQNLLVNGELYIEPPIGNSGYTTCTDITFVGLGGSLFAWNFGDGNTMTTISPSVSHSYTAPGNYAVSVTITNDCGNSETYSGTVSVNAIGGPALTFTSSSDVNCNSGSDGSATVSAISGDAPFTYLWDDPAGQTTATAGNLVAGTYNVTVTDVNGCSTTSGITIDEPVPITLTTAIVEAACGTSNGSASVSPGSGTSPYTYLWSSGGTDSLESNLSAGSYTVTVTDSSGCSTSAAVNIINTGGPGISSSVNDVTCNDGADGSIDITISGVPPFTYSWSNGNTIEDINNLTAGTYTLTVTDSNGCQSSVNATVAEPTVINIGIITVNADCGQANGSAIANVSGGTTPYTYLWDDGLAQTTDTASALSANAYNVLVTDANSCTNSAVATVSNANAPTITQDNVNNISCYGASDGAINISVTSGTTPYQYFWMPVGYTTQDISNLTPGVYTLMLQDGVGCWGGTSIEITEPDSLFISTSAVDAHCGYTDGSATASVSGGTTPYYYVWSSGGTGATETGLDTGSYTITVTDANGCTAVNNVTISVNTDPQAICIVTVDTTSTKNIVVWDKPVMAMGIDSFRVYREIAGLGYAHVGSVAYDSLSEFVDTTSGVNPQTTSYRYKLSVIDSCSNESELSDYHETVHLTVNLGIPPALNLIWDNYEGFGFNYYRILRDSTGTGNFEVLDSVTSSNTTYTDPNPPTGYISYVIEVVHSTGCTSTLKAKDYNSSKSNTSSIATGSAPVSDFTADMTSILTGDTVNFTDLSVNDPTSWSWTFDGGTPSSSTVQNPTNIVYADTGCYNVTLVATNVFGSDSIAKTCYINVDTTGSAPAVNFSANIYSIVAGGSVNFTDISTNNPTSWAWTFTGGNPSSSTVQDPTNITYSAAGFYDVKLVATNAFGSDSLTETNYIEVSSVGIDEFQVSSLKFKVYPNPNKGIFNLEIYLEEKEDVKIDIFDMRGQLIYSEQTGRISGIFNKEIDLSGYRGGIYHLQVITKKGVINKKIVRE
ncbi:MAG: PKD domain-containing protein [Bacteroidota bacterium]